MRHSSSFHSQNEILKKLHEMYFVSNVFNEDPKKTGRYLIYDAPDQGGLYFMFEVGSSPSSKKYVTFNGNKYSDVDELLKDAEEYRNKLFFPSEYYDPNNRHSFNTFDAIKWYLRSLGFEYDKDFTHVNLSDTYVMYDKDKQPLMHITVNEISRHDDDNIQGSLTKTLNKGSFIKADFTSREQAVGIINTMVGTDATVNLKKMTDCLDNIKGDFDALDEAKIYDKNSFFTGITRSAKDDMIPVLEDLLTSLKKEKKEAKEEAKEETFVEPVKKTKEVVSKWHTYDECPPKDGKMHTCLVRMTENNEVFDYICNWFWNKEQKGWFLNGRQFAKTDDYEFKWIDIDTI